ncbi:hypothetical protein EIP86_001852 [Pleurotus ostreatoroseus]|nr:hypothetical protein EIP86_001852 [Pleurotus ostreatoroseus]
MSSLELRVELPTHSYSFRIQVQLSWTVLDVKDEIKRVCPGSPRVDGQRVIWRGRLLRDEELVMDIWKPTAAHASSQASQIPTRTTQRRTVYPEPAPQFAPTVPFYIVKRHTDAVHVLTHGQLPAQTTELSQATRNLAVATVQAAGWSWPPILDEPYPAASQSSTEGVKYEQVTIENQQYLKLSSTNTTPTPIQQHALKVLSHTFPLLSITLYPPPMWAPMPPYPMPYPLTQPAVDLNQHLQRLGMPPLRLAPNANPNANPNDPNNPALAAADIRAIPLRALLMPLIMLVVRTFILMYFFSPSKRPVFGILLSLWIIYETWGALRAIIGNDRPGDAFGAGAGARDPAGGGGVGAGANGQPRAGAGPAQGQPRRGDAHHAASRRPSDLLLSYLASMGLRREEQVLNADAPVPAPEPSLVHKATAFVRLFVLSLHPAVWDRRRAALRRREGRLRTEANAREAPVPAPASAESTGAETEHGEGASAGVSAQEASRAQARAQLVARHERRPAWVRSYVERVQNAEWADDA